MCIYRVLQRLIIETQHSKKVREKLNNEYITMIWYNDESTSLISRELLYYIAFISNFSDTLYVHKEYPSKDMYQWQD